MSTPGGEATVLTEPGDDLDRALEIFLAMRTQLFRIARRVTGDIANAEDVVQDAWLRWQRTDRRDIKNPAAFLTTTTTHLAINVIQSARHRHEIPTDLPLADLGVPAQDPLREAEQAATVEELLRELMARLSPAELATYLLRKGFDYPYDAIAGVLRTTTANARQLARRAQQRLDGDPGREVDPDAHRLVTDAFLVAARTGELKLLEGLLAESAASTMRPHARRPARPAHRQLAPRIA
ncbi:sigma-70 family RNA polymerase sigma factor [Nocardioides sp. NPDC087217]|uniref:sigma-70 family RNA polymerase sigma factor n=1 Tax=Nocardioides sp. NPDC087217 TaxID=3364335 RepID=UPI00380C2FC8